MFSDLCSLLDRVIDWWSWRRPEIPSRLPLDGGPQRESAVKSVWAGSRLSNSPLVPHSAKHPARENTDSRTLSINCQSTALIVRTLFIALVLIPENSLCASQLSQAWALGRWEEEEKHCVLWEETPSAFVCLASRKSHRNLGAPHVSSFGFPPLVPWEMMGNLASFFLKRFSN